MEPANDKNLKDLNWADYFDSLINDAWIEARERDSFKMRAGSRKEPKSKEGEAVIEPRH